VDFGFGASGFTTPQQVEAKRLEAEGEISNDKCERLRLRLRLRRRSRVEVRGLRQNDK
jgi:hypothetical protein